MDWMVISRLAGLALQLLTLLGIVLVKFNDLKHLGKDMEIVKTEQILQGKKIARIEGKLDIEN